MKRIYLDHAASPPLDPEVKQVMDEVQVRAWANASSLHAEGREARGVIDDARDQIAKILDVETDNLVFTSGATESNVLALRGVLEYVRLKGSRPHLVLSKIEHPSLKEPAEQLQKMGLDITWVGVDKNGLVDPKELTDSIKDNTALVSIIYGNHETGVVQDIPGLVKAVKSKNANVLFHTDAAQSLGWLDFKIKDLGVDLLTASSYKLYGAKGIGLLYLNSNVKIHPLFPGVQEWGIRGGTESTALIAGMARALELSSQWPRSQVRDLRNYLISKVTQKIPDVLVNTYLEKSLPHIAHFSFAGIEADSLTIALDRAGVAASPGSACSSGSVKVSHIIEALGIDVEKYSGSLRLSLGINTTQEEIDKAVGILEKVVSDLRANVVK